MKPTALTRQVIRGLAGLVLVSSGLVFVASTPGGALTTVNVDKAGDTATPSGANCPATPAGTCTLRDAFALANATNDDVQINVPVSLSPISLSTGNELLYNGGVGGTHSLTLAGTGGNVTIAQKPGAAQRVMEVTAVSPSTVTLQNLTITGGNDGTGVGGVLASANLTIVSSTVTGNTGEGINSGANMQMTSSTLSNNSAGGATATNMTVRGSTISGNTGGPGLAASNLLVLVNSTVSGNSDPSFVGGVLVTPQLPALNALQLVYSTISGNTGSVAANVRVSALGNMESFASVVALPQGGGPNCRTSSATNSQGFNLEDDAAATCGFSAGSGDLPPGTPAGLGSLANNGGPTLTQLPQPGSPLIDAIPVASCQADGAAGISTDERGISRPQGIGCDIGAVEVQATSAPSPTATVVTPRFTG